MSLSVLRENGPATTGLPSAVVRLRADSSEAKLAPDAPALAFLFGSRRSGCEPDRACHGQFCGPTRENRHRCVRHCSYLHCGQAEKMKPLKYRALLLLD